MDVAAYLARIGYDGPVSPSTETLAALHDVHLTAVPFENLDIHLGRPIVLDVAALFDKIVRRRRGGFCYELNGLFARLLEHLGFAVDRLSAGVMSDDGVGPEFDHLALLVTHDGPWLVDVGFGQSFRAPLRLVDGLEQVQGRDSYRVDSEGSTWLMRERLDGAPWTPRYRFSLTPRTLGAFHARCRHHERSPASSFPRRRICSLATADGRVTLSGTTLIERSGGMRRESTVASDREYRTLLRDRFGVDVGEAPWRHPLPGGERE